VYDTEGDCAIKMNELSIYLADTSLNVNFENNLMDIELQNLIQDIHDSPKQAVIAVAGAGTTGLANLLLVGGASRTVLEAIVPYSLAAFDSFLDGQTPKQYVSSLAAHQLAGAALIRAQKLSSGTSLDNFEDLIGVSCTAALSSDRIRRGEHRVHIATWQARSLTVRTLVLIKGERNREDEERTYSRLLLNALAEACGINRVLDLALKDNEHVLLERYDYESMAQRLRQNKLDFFALYAHGKIRTRPATGGAEVHPQTLLSGSFNPLHKGHLGMAKAASKWLERPVAFELAAINVDKPSLTEDTILKRIAQFAGKYPIYISNAPTYLEKSRLYRNATFVIGYDTAKRLFYPKYYDNSEAQMLNAFAEIAENNCRFLVTGRVDEDDVFRTLTDLSIPADYRKLFESIPEEQFRLDISSTELRNE